MYKINIENDMNQYDEVLSLANYVDRDFPSNYLSNNKEFETFVFMTSLFRKQEVELSECQREEYDRIHKSLDSKIKSTVISKSFKTTYDEKDAYHEVTAGLIDKPFSAFLENFDPARDWGRSLVGYLGGELVADKSNDKNKAVLLRERMVLAAPWYALGTPDMDMSKYENVQYEKDSVRVNWFVTKSENDSVYLDVGYLQFNKYVSGNTEKTMAVFNSIHRINSGCILNVLPKSMQSVILPKVLSNMFSNYIRGYQKL